MDKLPIFIINHWELFAALVVIIGLLVIPPALDKVRGILSIEPVDALVVINHKDALVVDVREDSEYAGGHILGSEHVPLSRLKKELGRLEKYKGRPAVVVCATGSRSRRAAAMLKQSGFETVYNLRGGVMAWNNANLPLTTK